MPRLGTILFLALAILSRAFHGTSFAQSEKPRTASEQLDAVLADVESQIARFRDEKKQEAAGGLTKELADLRGRMAGDYNAPTSDVPEVHMVGVYQGSTAPAGLLTGKDRYTTGYAEVHVSYTARPVILVISACEPVLWRVKLSDGVKLRAVVLGGYRSQTVDGLPEGTLVLRRIVGEGSPLRVHCYTREHRSFDQANNQIRYLTGYDVTTLIGTYRYGGNPLVVGPENREWRAQHLLVEATRLRERAMADERQRKLNSIQHLRFRAVYYSGRPNDETGPGNPSAAIGDYTIHGPISSTLKSIPSWMRQLVVVPQEDVQFALNHHCEFGVVSEGEPDFSKVPFAADMPQTRFSAATYDSKRHRIVLASRDDKPRLFSYDLARASWQPEGETKHFLSSLTYVPEKDVFYGITSEHRRPHHEPAKAVLLAIGANGKVQQETGLSKPVNTQWWDWGGVQLAVADGHAVVLTPPRRDRFRRYVSHLHVVDPDTGEVIYSGLQRPNDGENAPKEFEPPAAGGGLLHQLWTKFAEAEEFGAELRRKNKTDQADEFSNALARLRDEFEGKYRDSNQPELHLVGIHVADGTRVRVTDTTRPIVLALCSYNESQWTVDVGAGVNLKRVIVGGYHRQRVNGVPEGVPLDIYTYDDRTGGFHTYKRDDPRFADVTRTLRDKTGLDITTFQGTYKYTGHPIVIGPENSEWRIQRLVDSLDKLLKSAEETQSGRRAARWKELRFCARYFKTHARHGGQPETLYAEFTVRGPLMHTVEPFRVSAEQVVEDSKSDSFILRNRGDITVMDRETGVSEQLEWDATLPRLSWPSAIALDSRRNRLLLTSFGGGGYLYGCDLETEKWSVLRKPGLGSSALVYSEQEDVLYGLNLNMGGERLRALTKFNPEGVVLSQVNLTEPIALDRHFSSCVQLRYAAGYVAILTALPTARPDRALPLQVQPVSMQVHVVDPESGKVVYHGKLEPHVAFQNLSDATLRSLWSDLLIADDDKADKLAWHMATGHENTVRFLAGRFRAEQTYEADEVRRLIADLDSDRFATRQKAYETLRSMGSVVRTVVEEAVEQKVSAEVRSRLRRLLETWNEGVSTDPELRRELRGVLVLQRIDRDAAIDLLKELGEGNRASLRAGAARKALEEVRPSESQSPEPGSEKGP